MGRIVISENVSLDGVMEDPTGEEGSRQGGWFQQFLNGDSGAWAEFGLEQALAASKLPGGNPAAPSPSSAPPGELCTATSGPAPSVRTTHVA